MAKGVERRDCSLYDDVRDKSGSLVTVFILNHWADSCGLAEWSMTDGFAMESSDGRWLEDLQIRAAISMGRTNRTWWLSLRSHQRCSWFFLASHPKTPRLVVIGRRYRFDIHIFMNQMYSLYSYQVPLSNTCYTIFLNLIHFLFANQTTLSRGKSILIFNYLPRAALSSVSSVAHVIASSPPSTEPPNPADGSGATTERCFACPVDTFSS